jgi:hypothetical protein
MPATALQPKRLKEIIRIGDFAYCRSKRYRDSLQLPQEPGVVIEIKRASHKLLYASDRRAWVPRETLVKMPPPPDSPEFLRTLNRLLRAVDAHECEVAATEGIHQISAQIDRIAHTTIDELRTFLGARFISITIVPVGMAFVQVEIFFHAGGVKGE